MNRATRSALFYVSIANCRLGRASLRGLGSGVLAVLSVVSVAHGQADARRQALLGSKATLERAIHDYDRHIVQITALVNAAVSAEASARQQGNTTQAAVSLGHQALASARRFRAEAQQRLAAIDAALSWPDSERNSAVPLLIRGSVRILGPDGQPVALNGTIPLRPGDSVESGRDGYVELQFPSGARIGLGSNSSFIYSQSGNQSIYDLLRGKLHAIDSHLKNGFYHVHSPNIAVAVRGTEFILNSNGAGTTFTVLSGAIDLRLRPDQPVVSLNAGQQLRVPAGAQDLSSAAPVSIDLKAVHSWWTN